MTTMTTVPPARSPTSLVSDMPPFVFVSLWSGTSGTRVTKALSTWLHAPIVPQPNAHAHAYAHCLRLRLRLRPRLLAGRKPRESLNRMNASSNTTTPELSPLTYFPETGFHINPAAQSTWPGPFSLHRPSRSNYAEPWLPNHPVAYGCAYSYRPNFLVAGSDVHAMRTRKKKSTYTSFMHTKVGARRNKPWPDLVECIGLAFGAVHKRASPGTIHE